MQTIQQEIDERTNLTSSNKLELLLFRLGEDANLDRNELFGINVFKIREIIPMPTITAVAGSPSHMMGVVDLRGQVIPVIDLAAVAGCTPKTGLNILLITEYARSTQAFAVESVEDIVRLDWRQVLSAEGNAAGGMVTSLARLDGDNSDRLAQVLDVETILRQVMPSNELDVDPERIGPKVEIKPGTVILAADDSLIARTMIEEGLTAMGLPYIMCKTGKEAWDQLQAISTKAQAEGKDGGRQGRPGADRSGNARDGRLYPDPQHQAGSALQCHAGGDSLLADRLGQRGACQKGRRRCLCGEVCR